MNKRISIILAALLLTAAAGAQSARTILDRAAATVSNPGGVQAHFQIITKQGTTNGQIAVKRNMFQASTPEATVWFDGKTQWTYMKGNEEVNVSNPTEAELQSINPYNFINIYKKGFKLQSKTVGGAYEVHLTPKSRQSQIEEMYIIVDKSTSHPTHVKMRRKGKWSVIIISQLKTTSLSDDIFRFNASDFPKAEIIDLR